jgi:hypothetical protein
MQVVIIALVLVLFYYIWPIAAGLSLGFIFKWSTKTTIIVSIPVAIASATTALLLQNWTAGFFITAVAAGLAGLISMSFV